MFDPVYMKYETLMFKVLDQREFNYPYMLPLPSSTDSETGILNISLKDINFPKRASIVDMIECYGSLDAVKESLIMMSTGDKSTKRQWMTVIDEDA